MMYTIQVQLKLLPALLSAAGVITRPTQNDLRPWLPFFFNLAE